jgi:hypothetical protein
MQSPGFIPCQSLAKNFPEDKLRIFKQKLAVERLETKSSAIIRQVIDVNYHWEEVFWWHIARSFGYRVNADSFNLLARSIPLNVLAKHRSNLVQVEAVLFGQAGILNKNFDEKYPAMLKREYHFLKSKYKLTQVVAPLHFLRMRPANFPTIRIAQLASLISQSHQLFTRISEAADLKHVTDLFKTSPNDYWLYHYRFDEPVAFKEKRLGDDMIKLLIINTVIPFLFAYGRHKDDVILVNRAIQWLAASAPENNVIIRNFKAIGIGAENSLQSQSLLELKTVYCDNRNCLECEIGKYLLLPGN